MRALTFAATAIAVSATMAAAPAMAFNCQPISNFGPEGTSLGNVLTCASSGGGGGTVTITGPGGGFDRLDEGSGWSGEFAHGDPLLFDNGTPGNVTIDFSGTSHNVNDISVQANLGGSYTATVQAFLNGVLVGTDSYTGNNALGPEGTIPSFNLSVAGGYNELIFSTTNDGSGFAFGFDSSAVPEPAAWAMMLAGFLGLGSALRLRRKLATASV